MNDLDIWNRAATAWSKKVTGGNTLRSVLFSQAIDQLIPNPRGLKILDAGCGDGVFTDKLQQQGAEMVGCDGAAEMVKIAQTKYPNCNFVVADLLKPLPFQDHSFDLVLSNMVLMHLSEIKTFLAECTRVLKPGGRLIFSVLHPAFNYPTMRLYKSWLDKLLMKKPAGLVYNYFQRQVTRRHESNMNQELTHYHRTIGDYTLELQKAGFVIELLAEPHELDQKFLTEHPKLEYTTRLPRFLFIKAKLQ